MTWADEPEVIRANGVICSYIEGSWEPVRFTSQGEIERRSLALAKLKKEVRKSKSRHQQLVQRLRAVTKKFKKEQKVCRVKGGTITPQPSSTPNPAPTEVDSQGATPTPTITPSRVPNSAHQFPVKTYKVQHVQDNKLLVINDTLFEVHVFCPGWQAQDTVTFLSGNGEGACATARILNITKNSSCDTLCSATTPIEVTAVEGAAITIESHTYYDRSNNCPGIAAGSPILFLDGAADKQCLSTTLFLVRQGLTCEVSC
jgi:hypothetical protein